MFARQFPYFRSQYKVSGDRLPLWQEFVYSQAVMTGPMSNAKVSRMLLELLLLWLSFCNSVADKKKKKKGILKMFSFNRAIT